MLKQIITTSYGDDEYSYVNKLQQLYIKSATAKNQWIFLERCICHDILPKSFATRPTINTHKARNITNAYNKSILVAARTEAKERYHGYLQNIKSIRSHLIEKLSPEHFNIVDNVTEKSRESTFLKKRTQLQEKFSLLHKRKNNHQVNVDQRRQSTTVKSAVLNLAKVSLSNHQEDLLNLGPKFVPTKKELPTMEIITTTELAAFELSKKKDNNHAEKLRNDVIKVIKKATYTNIPSNLDRFQQKALRELRESDHLKVYPYDKGTGFVVLEKEDAASKLCEQLQEAKECQSDPTDKLTRKFQRVARELKKDGKIDVKTFREIYPSDAVPPRLYGLVKAHKPEKDYPMRTVVSTIGTPFHGSSAFLVRLIQPTLNKNPTRIINSTVFVKQAQQWNIEPEEVQVSFDVTSLYPSVPIKKAIDVIMGKLASDETSVQQRTRLTLGDIGKLLKMCLETCYFLWNDKLYEIHDTGPIGLSLMVVVAEGFLQHIESQALSIAINHQVAPKTFFRYVDDSHARFNKRDEALEFMNILNSLEPRIQYTIEHESTTGTLAFLDISITNNSSGKYEFAIYRKPAITNVMIKPNSAIDPKIPPGVFKGFLARAMRTCSENRVQDEFDFLINVFVENGYKKEYLDKLVQEYTTKIKSPIEKANPSTEDAERTFDNIVRLPWIPVIGPKLRRILKKTASMWCSPHNPTCRTSYATTRAHSRLTAPQAYTKSTVNAEQAMSARRRNVYPHGLENTSRQRRVPTGNRPD